MTAVIPDSAAVIPDPIRDPVPRAHWIAGQARNDSQGWQCQLVRPMTAVIPDAAVLIPASVAVLPTSTTVIPDSMTVIPDLLVVIPDSIRDPLPRHHWIAGAETPDLIRGRNDSEGWQ